MKKHQTVSKIDFTHKFPDLFTAQHGVAEVVSVPKFHFIKASGQGFSTKQDSGFVGVKRFLSGLAFTIKFRLKRLGNQQFQDYVMPPIQVEWVDLIGDATERKWEMYLMQPPTITENIVLKSLEVAKMKQQDTMLPKIEYCTKKRGTCLQTLHTGSYDTIADTIDFLGQEAEKQGCILSGNRLDIYLNDLRRTAKKNLQTIVRYKIDKK